MTRRAFLRGLATAVAAASIVKLTALAEVFAPEVDWARWHHVEATVRRTLADRVVVSWRLDGQPVVHPATLRDLAHLFDVNPEGEAVRFGPYLVQLRVPMPGQSVICGATVKAHPSVFTRGPEWQPTIHVTDTFTAEER